MRPIPLDPLFVPLRSLPGVGPRTAPLLDRVLGRREARAVDLLFHAPNRALDLRARATLAEAPYGEPVTVVLRVEEHRPPGPGRKGPYRVLCADGTGDVELAYFNVPRGRMEKLFPVGATRWITGAFELFDGRRQLVHPDRVAEGAEGAPGVEPVYPLTEGLTGRVLGRVARRVLDRLPELPEWQDPEWLRRRGWASFAGALRGLHAPGDPADVAEDGPHLARLAYDELLAGQLALLLVRERLRRRGGRPTLGDGGVGARVRAALPFTLTDGQEAAVADVLRDMAAPERMLRLLQGDVGSGKTAVAVLAMARAAEAGRQAVLMAPTEVLARQHFERVGPLARAAGLSPVLVTGRDRPAERAVALAALADGSAEVAVGTHALFQDPVAFRDLALAVVDEQHRFGVHQRLALARKGAAVDLLVMTATPIPRSLALTAFGDMDVSVLAEKPAGRQPIDTRALPLERLDEVVGAVLRAVEAGRQVYWVCPLVEESEVVDAAAAVDRHAALVALLGERAALVHGRLAGEAKDAAVDRFRAGEARVLVATTVIEVGVDVPNASVMVIEHAERFGLSQLHQLRGRVGRGAARSTCLLLYKAPLGETGEARLRVLRDTEDGFRIAEEDLRLRGGGDLLGTRQSGTPGHRLARVSVHGALLAAARDDAALVHARDPKLEGERGRALRHLLYLFERDEAVRLLEAG